jgi:thiol-disulfide isomerase/thioredoxin
MKNKTIITIIIAAIILVVAYILFTNYKQTRLDNLSKCLTEKNVVFYGASWCSHCQQQKEILGSSFKYVNIANQNVNEMINKSKRKREELSNESNEKESEGDAGAQACSLAGASSGETLAGFSDVLKRAKHSNKLINTHLGTPTRAGRDEWSIQAGNGTGKKTNISTITKIQGRNNLMSSKPNTKPKYQNKSQPKFKPKTPAKDPYFLFKVLTKCLIDPTEERLNKLTENKNNPRGLFFIVRCSC